MLPSNTLNKFYQQRMYSKYLEYSEAALKATRLAQAESEQKDVLIAHLKNEVYELRRIEGDYLHLNNLIRALEEKYSLLLDEKERCEKEQRVKSDIDKNGILALKEEIDLQKVNLQKANLQIENLIRENTLKKRMNDARLNEIQATTQQIRGVDSKNVRTNEEGQNLSLTVKSLKQERKRLEEECDSLAALLDGNVGKLKNLEKTVRNNESINARLEKTLRLAESDNQKLVSELKANSEDVKRAENKLRSLNNQINEVDLDYRNVVAQAEKFKAESGANAAGLNNEIAKGKQLSSKLASLQASIRSEENQLDQIIANQEKQRQQNFENQNESKYLNGELDRLLMLISEYEQINKELVDEIDIYSVQDEEAFSILNRKQVMKDVRVANNRKIAQTGELIRGIRY